MKNFAGSCFTVRHESTASTATDWTRTGWGLALQKRSLDSGRSSLGRFSVPIPMRFSDSTKKRPGASCSWPSSR